MSMQRLRHFGAYLGSSVWQRRLFVWLIVITVINIVSKKLYYNVYKNICSTENSLSMIADTCQQYRTGLVDGSLCPALCDNDVITFRHCVNWRFGKVVAYMDHHRLTGDTDKLVLKALFNPPDNDFTLYDFMKNKTHLNETQLIQEFRLKLFDRLKTKFNFRFSDTNFDVLTYMWGFNVTKYVANSQDKKEALGIALRSLWYLVQQREYVFSKIHQKSNFATKVTGTCGAIYLLEFAGSLSELKSGLFRGRGIAVHTQDWKKRAAHAIEILKLLPVLKTQYHEPIDMCDIKEPNFGLRQNGEVVLIDSDDVHYQSAFSHDLARYTCTQHEQCGRLTCPAHCDKEKGICKTSRTNNDLQSVCERVFLNKVGFASTGLLSGAPETIKRELSILLDRCAYPPSGISPTWDSRHVIHKPSDSIRQLLISVIQKGIDS